MPNIDYEREFLLALVQTITIETIVLFILIRYLYRLTIKTNDILFAGFVCSFATLPYVWFIFPLLKIIGTHALYIWSAEISVTLIETVMMQRLLKVNYKTAFVLSLFANLLSYGSGYIL